MVALRQLPPIELGLVMVTPGLLEALGGDRDVAMRRLGNEVLARFICHDWGRVDAEDRAANDRDLTTGGRVLAAYDLLAADGKTKLKTWVVHYPRIRDGDDRREPETTICLPSEY
jgi:hypothetical protein